MFKKLVDLSLAGYEIILGSSIDPQLGPVLLFGMGGSLVEVFKDSAVGLPPLNANLARKMLEETKLYKALLGVRGMKSVNIEALIQIMVRFSVLIVDLPETCYHSEGKRRARFLFRIW